MGIKVNMLANQIARQTRRGPGNFIVGNALAVSLLQTLGSVFVPVPKGSKTNDLLNHVGTLNGTIAVYYSMVVPDGELIIGYKGSGEVDTGYVYSPYIPVMMTGTMIDPATFQPVMGMMTRYGTTTYAKDEKRAVPSDAYYALLHLGDPVTPAEAVDQLETVE
jgi:hypothetical protein